MTVDEALREAISRCTRGWEPARTHAALKIIGWSSGGPVTLAEAGLIVGASRETARRARNALTSKLCNDTQVGRAAHMLDEFLVGELEHLPQGSDVVTLAQAAHRQGVLTHVGRLVPSMRLLAAAQIPLSASTDGLIIVPATVEHERVALATQVGDGRPYDLDALLADAGPQGHQATEDLLESGHWRRVSGRWVALCTEHAQHRAAVRSLRRLLSMTGPLPWADVLVAWSRARGRPPYAPLPADTDLLTAWVHGLPGLRVRPSSSTEVGQVVENTAAIDLDRTSQFLLEQLTAWGGTTTRAALFDAAKREGLKPSTLAVALSYHPAIVSPAREAWSLRRSPEQPIKPTGTGAHDQAEHTTHIPVAPVSRVRRRRPTTYTWSPTGELVLNASVPSGPSPVISVPRAIADILEGRALPLSTAAADSPAVLTVHNSKAWGFGPLLAVAELSPGERFNLTCNLLEGTATLSRATTEASA